MFKKIIHNLWSDSLYRNSFWLMAGSFSMAGIGFVYWIIAARLYTPEQIGLATTFLSAGSLINGLAMLGFGTTLIRYLPTSEVKEKKINTAFTVVTLASLLFGIIYLIGLPWWTPKLMFVRSSIPLLLLTIFFFPINTINGITDSVFTAFREAHWVFASNITQSVTKLLVLILLPALGAWGVIGSNVVSIVAAVVLCLVLIAVRYQVKFRAQIDRDIILKVRKFTLGNHLSGLISGLPNLILPILITNKLAPEQTAYYYMPNMIVGILNIVPSAVSKSFLTEGSRQNKKLSFFRPLLVSLAILIPVVLFLVLFGKNILFIFGHKYADAGYYYLMLMCISVIISTSNYIFGTRMLLEDNVNKLVKLQLYSTTLYIIASVYFLRFGIIGTAIASISSQIFSFLYLIVFSNKNKITDLI